MTATRQTGTEVRRRELYRFDGRLNAWISDKLWTEVAAYFMNCERVDLLRELKGGQTNRIEHRGISDELLEDAIAGMTEKLSYETEASGLERNAIAVRLNLVRPGQMTDQTHRLPTAWLELASRLAG